MAEFDPYYKWLGISPEEQPPHHYRLLGVKQFEPDSDVIQAAADRQMAYLRSLSTGQRVKDAQKLLNEMSVAASCLLTPAKRAAYDADLKAKLDAQRPREQPLPVAPVFQAQPLQPTSLNPITTYSAMPGPAPVQVPAPRAATKLTPKKSSPPAYLPWAIGGGAFAVMALLALVIIVSLKPSDGMLIVEVDQPNAVVNLLDANGKIELTTLHEGKGKLSITLAPGKHQLKIEKNGFATYSTDFEIASRGKRNIHAKLLAEQKSPVNALMEVAKLPAVVPKPIESPSSTMVLEFNGYKCYVATPLFYDGTHPITIEAFVTSTTTTNQPEYIIGDSENGGIFLGLQNRRFEMGYRVTSNTNAPGAIFRAIAPEAISPNRLYHVAGVFDRNEVRVFVDGALQRTTRGGPFKASPMPLVIGANPGTRVTAPPFFKSTTEDYQGTIREVRISKISRYAGNFTPKRRLNPDADTMALYHLDEGSGSIARDVSSNALHGTIVGAKWVKDQWSATSNPPTVATVALTTPTPVAPVPAVSSTPPTTSFKGANFEAWAKVVAALPTDRQVEAVTKKLQELNPGFDGKVVPQINAGIVNSLQFSTLEVTDISPVRALTGLKVLNCGSNSGNQKGKLSDLSPVQGMPLTSLYCANTIVSDISALKGSSLTDLLFQGTNIADLSPLQGLRLTNLNCVGTPVADLSPLQGMPMKVLNLQNTQVKDLSPLRGLPLTVLWVDSTLVEDVSPLLEMYSLVQLRLDNTKVSPADITKLRQALPKCKITATNLIASSASASVAPMPPDTSGKPLITYHAPALQEWAKTVAALPAAQQAEAVAKKLQELNPGTQGKTTPIIRDGTVVAINITESLIDLSPITALPKLKTLNYMGSASPNRPDLSPLSSMQLTALDVRSCNITDISALKGLPLTNLILIQLPITDISPLKGMQLNYLILSFTKVSDLSPLRGMRIDHTQFANTPVSDISPLAGMPLTIVTMNNTLVSDLSPLKGIKLKSLNCSYTPVADISPLLEMSTLTSLNLRSTKVSPADVDKLKQALPNCKITWDDPAAKK